MRILILFPLILYLGIVVFNLEMLKQVDSVNIYGILTLEAPVLFYLSIFFVIYVIFVVLIFDSIGAFRSHKVKKIEKEVFELKSKLYDEREDELVVFLGEQRQRIENFIKSQEDLLKELKAENEAILSKQKSDTDRILDKFGLLEEGMLQKIKKSFKGKN